VDEIRCDTRVGSRHEELWLSYTRSGSMTYRIGTQSHELVPG
jgi:hypothetical protein